MPDDIDCLCLTISIACAAFVDKLDKFEILHVVGSVFTMFDLKTGNCIMGVPSENGSPWMSYTFWPGRNSVVGRRTNEGYRVQRRICFMIV